jgi:hypothetical protein
LFFLFARKFLRSFASSPPLPDLHFPLFFATPHSFSLLLFFFFFLFQFLNENQHQAAFGTPTERGRRSAPGPRSWRSPASSSRRGSGASTRTVTTKTAREALLPRAATRREGGRRGGPLRHLTEKDNVSSLSPPPLLSVLSSFLSIGDFTRKRKSPL